MDARQRDATPPTVVAIWDAVENVPGRSQASLARLVGVRRQAVRQWIISGRVPAERALAIERVSGVPRHRLRPDLYPL